MPTHNTIDGPLPVRAEDTATFANSLVAALQRIRDDGTLPPDAVHELRDAIDATAAEARQRVAFDPGRHLGDFDALPENARNAIVDAIVTLDRWGPRAYRLGPAYTWLLRGLWRLKHAVYRAAGPQTPAGNAARGLADFVAYGARKAPSLAMGLVQQQWQRARGRYGGRPRLLDMLRLAGIPPFDLAAGFARGLPQEPPYRGYWHDSSRHVAVGRVLGVDLLPTDDGFWYVESNVHPALEEPRSALYDLDPMCRALVDFAAGHDFRRLMVLDNTSSGIDPKMSRDYAAEAARAGLELSLPVLPNVPGHARLRSWEIPDDVREQTFVVRIRPYPVSLDHILGSKRATYRVLRRYQARTRESALRLPRTSAAPEVASVDAASPFPNLVYKLPDIEQGRGVWFLKARSGDDARGMLATALRTPRKRSLDERALLAMTSKEGVFQPFIRPRNVDGRLYKVRAMVLVSPLGVRCLSAHRIVAAAAVPGALDFGVVSDMRPYMINTGMGGAPSRVPDDELAGVAEAAEAVARGFAWGIETAYRVGPG